MSVFGQANSKLIAAVLIIALLVGGFLVYQNQQADIEIELPDVEIGN